MSGRDVREVPVNACRHCPLPERLPDGHPHAQRWNEAAGWHAWTPPTQEQIKQRMIARRSARIMTREARR